MALREELKKVREQCDHLQSRLAEGQSLCPSTPIAATEWLDQLVSYLQPSGLAMRPRALMCPFGKDFKYP